MVFGHSDCGAVNAAYTDAMPGGNIQAIVDVIKPGIAGAVYDIKTSTVRFL